MVPNQSTTLHQISSLQKIIASLDVSWHRTTTKKQTLFAVFSENDEPKKAKRGVPPKNSCYSLRATKGVNMHPFLHVKLTTENGSKWKQEEDIRLSLVNAKDHSIPRAGACPCRGRPILSESKPNQLVTRNGEIYSKIKDGLIEFNKMQIGCCTGARGHGSPLCLKVEFIREGSPLKGKILYSPQIDVGAKGPFAKIFCNNTNSAQSNVTAPSIKKDPVPTTQKRFSPSYEGAEEMLNLLNSLNLQRYSELFVKHEVDIQAFLQLKDEDLINIGITKVGPRVKILNEIALLKETPSPISPISPFSPPLSSNVLNATNNASSSSSSPPPSSPFDEWFPDYSLPLFEDSLFPSMESFLEQSPKRRKVLSTTTCSSEDQNLLMTPFSRWEETL